ncbi:hypothetical protein Landi51_11243 [Colletotrichum acutatum]
MDIIPHADHVPYGVCYTLPTRWLSKTSPRDVTLPSQYRKVLVTLPSPILGRWRLQLPTDACLSYNVRGRAIKQPREFLSNPQNIHTPSSLSVRMMAFLDKLTLPSANLCHLAGLPRRGSAAETMTPPVKWLGADFVIFAPAGSAPSPSFGEPHRLGLAQPDDASHICALGADGSAAQRPSSSSSTSSSTPPPVPSIVGFPRTSVGCEPRRNRTCRAFSHKLYPVGAQSHRTKMPGKGPMLQGGCYANVVQLPVKPSYSMKSMGFQSPPRRRRNRFMDKGSLNLDLEARLVHLSARPAVRHRPR